MRRTARYQQVDRQQIGGPVVHLRVAGERAAADGACPHGDDDLRRGDRIVGLLERELHVLGDRAGDEQAVRVSRRRHELHPEPPEVPAHRVEDIGIELAPIAAARRYLAQLERPPEQAMQLRTQLRGERERILIAADHEVLAPAHRETIVIGEGDRALGTGLHAVGAEEAAAEVDLSRLPARDRLGRTGLRARAAAGPAQAGVDLGPAAKPRGQLRRRPVRKRHGPMTLKHSSSKETNHRSKPA